MKKIFVLAMMFLFMFSATALASDSVEKQRQQINALHAKTLERLYEKYPHAQRVINQCYAYATLSNTGIKVGLFGSSHGRGLAVNNVTGERVYMRMEEQSVGLGLGVKEYDLVFLINTREAWDNFLIGKIRFAASAEAAANDGVTGGSIEGAEYVAPGVWVFRMTTKGDSLEATLKGMKIFKNKKLN